MPLIRTRLMERLRPMASECGPIPDPASRALDDDVVRSLQGERSEFRQDRPLRPRPVSLDVRADLQLEGPGDVGRVLAPVIPFASPGC
jgi:hypothetical protein